MRLRLLSAALVGLGWTLMAGCPAGLDLGGLLDGFGSDGSGSGSYDLIPNGTYEGTLNASDELRQYGEVYDQNTWSDDKAASFRNGAYLRNTGAAYQVGDVENMQSGGLIASREVFDVEVDDAAYYVAFDLTATWNGVPMSGTEYIEFYGNEDGSVSMTDMVELISLDDYDGETWTYHLNFIGTLVPTTSSGSGGDGSSPGTGYTGDILDLKSGKIRH